jgi:hypothetical protein
MPSIKAPKSVDAGFYGPKDRFFLNFHFQNLSKISGNQFDPKGQANRVFLLSMLSVLETVKLLVKRFSSSYA